ncbi:MAG: hypothetical protein ACKPJJ_24035 [Planctomycetaceae bacterium]
MSRVAGDKYSACFNGSRRNDQVSIAAGVSAATGDDPKIFDLIKDIVSDWNNCRMRAEVLEPC